MFRIHVKIIYFLILTFCVGPISGAYAENSNAPEAIETFLKTIQDMDFPIKDQAAQDKKNETVAAYLDLRAMGEKSLGVNWGKMSEDEKSKFMALFWKLIESIAYPRTKKFLGDQKISYSEPKAIARGVEVSSSVHDNEAALDVPIVYNLYQEGTQWKIYDIFMDGVSMTEDLQYQFDKMIQDGSIQALLDRMAERLAQAQKEIAGA